jgi:hypothetical protein
MGEILSPISAGPSCTTNCPVPQASFRLQATRSLIPRARRSYQSSVQVLIQRHPTKPPKMAPPRLRVDHRREAIISDPRAHLGPRSRVTLSKISTGLSRNTSRRPSPVL